MTAVGSQAGEFYRDAKEDPSALLSASRWSLDGDRVADRLAEVLRPEAEEARGCRATHGLTRLDP